MIESVSLRIYDFVAKYVDIDEEMSDVYRYGIEITVSSFLNIVLVMILSLLLGDPLSGAVFLSCLISVRSYCGGYHADSYFKCNFMVLLLYLVTHLAATALFFFNISNFYLFSGLSLLAFVPFIAFSPVRNIHKELSPQKARKCRKMSFVLYILICLIGMMLTAYGSVYGSIVIVTLVDISVMILIEIFFQRRNKNETSS